MGRRSESLNIDATSITLLGASSLTLISAVGDTTVGQSFTRLIDMVAVAWAVVTPSLT